MRRDRLAAIRGEQEKSDSFDGSVSTPQYELIHMSEERGTMLDDVFYNEISDIQDEIRKLNANVDDMSRLHTQQIDAVGLSGTNTAKQLESVVEESRTLSFTLKKRIQLLRSQPLDARAARIRGPQIELVRSKFMDTIQRYQVEEKSYRDRTKDRIARQYMIVNPDATPEEVQAVVQSGQNMQVFAQATNGHRYGQAQSAYNVVRERHEEIKRIERTMAELAQLFQDMSLLVEQQGDVVDSIEEKAREAELDIEKGKNFTTTALTSALSYRNKRWICFVLFLVIIVIIAAVVGCEVSHKC